MTYKKGKRNLNGACPCGKSNKDGKFVAYSANEKNGYCFACGKYIRTDEGNYGIKDFFYNLSVKKALQPSYIPFHLFMRTLNTAACNNLKSFLIDRFDTQKVNEVFNKYYIGSSKLWPGSTIFWYVDMEGLVHSGKIIQYDWRTGKRIKEPHSRISWVHKNKMFKNFNYQSCLFGEHLIDEDNSNYAIAESEKSALIGALYYPQYTWLATGGKTILTHDRLYKIKNKKIVLFPDIDGIDYWRSVQIELMGKYHYENVIISEIMTDIATDPFLQNEIDLAKGDIADYILYLKKL